MTTTPVNETARAQTEAHEYELTIAAQSDAPVLITSARKHDRLGWARSIHAKSNRRCAPFIFVDCRLWNVRNDARYPRATEHGEDVREIRRTLQDVWRGTLFLDRIETMTAVMQTELFGLLDEISRQRGVSSLSSGPRIISGAGHSLLTEIAAGVFDEALFYRLNLIHFDLTGQRLQGGLMSVRDLMSTPPRTCRPDTDLGTVAQMMWDGDCGFVPVIDASGRLVGVITDRDICIATATRHLLPQHIAAERAMTGPVHLCMADDSVSDALAAMKQFKVRRLPVVDGKGQLEGVISINDLARASDQNRTPAPREVVSTLAAICAHPDRPGVTI